MAFTGTQADQTTIQEALTAEVRSSLQGGTFVFETSDSDGEATELEAKFRDGETTVSVGTVHANMAMVFRVRVNGSLLFATEGQTIPTILGETEMTLADKLNAAGAYPNTGTPGEVSLTNDEENLDTEELGVRDLNTGDGPDEHRIYIVVYAYSDDGAAWWNDGELTGVCSSQQKGRRFPQFLQE